MIIQIIIQIIIQMIRMSMIWKRKLTPLCKK